MAVQTQYNENLDALRLGHIYDTSNKDLISRSADADGIAFGDAVVESGVDGQARKVAADDVRILGIVARERSALGETYKAGADLRIICKGPVAVMASAAVAAGDEVHVVVADGTFTKTGGVVIEGARYESSGNAGDLVKVRLA